MIAHAIRIIQNELNQHLDLGYSNPPANLKRAELGNISLGVVGPGGGSIPVDRIILTLVNYREEKTLKNVPNYTRNDVELKVTYENPPVFLNLMLMFTATHTEYSNGLVDLSKIFRFFQSKNVFTQDTVAPSSLKPSKFDFDPLDHLASFKLIMELYSPSFEEINHLWGTLGGRQYPFVVYILRMLDLKYRAIRNESGVILNVESNFAHKPPTEL